MKKLTVCAILALGVVFSASARPQHHHREPPRRRPPMHRPAPRPPVKKEKVQWGLNIGPWGSSFSIGTRIGKHGGLSMTLPLSRPPVVREEKTIVVQQAQPIIVQQPTVLRDEVELNPVYVNNRSVGARTWVEGYYKVVRSPDGSETSRQWVPGHWE